MWMKKLVTLAKDPLIKVSSRITSFLEPEYIYLPIDEEIRQNIDYKKVKKGDLLYSWQGKKQYSPVSGKIVGFLQNSQGLFLKIQNDYREEDSYNGVKEFTTMSIRTNFQSQIKNFPDFDWSKFKNQKTLILNGIEDEPYAATRTFLNKLKSQEILEMLDLLRETFQMNEVLLYLKENDRESIEAFSKYLGKGEISENGNLMFYDLRAYIAENGINIDPSVYTDYTQNNVYGIAQMEFSGTVTHGFSSVTLQKGSEVYGPGTVFDRGTYTVVIYGKGLGTAEYGLTVGGTSIGINEVSKSDTEIRYTVIFEKKVSRVEFKLYNNTDNAVEFYKIEIIPEK